MNAMTISIRFMFITLTFGLLPASCSVVSDKTGANAITSTGLFKPTANQSEIVADFRDHNTQFLASGLSEIDTESDQAGYAIAKNIVETALGTGSFEQYRLADSALGNFTSPEQQSLHIIVNRQLTAIANEVTPSILLIFQNNKPVNQFVPTKASYLAILSVFDTDNDGMHEVLLTGTTYQMGTHFVSADVYSFKNPDNLLRQEMGVVYTNACESSVASTQQVQASILSLPPKHGELMAESFVAPCTNNKESPDSNQFTRASAH